MLLRDKLWRLPWTCCLLALYIKNIFRTDVRRLWLWVFGWFAGRVFRGKIPINRLKRTLAQTTKVSHWRLIVISFLSPARNRLLWRRTTHRILQMKIRSPAKIIWHRSIMFKTGRRCQSVNDVTCQSSIQIVVWNQCSLSFRSSSDAHATRGSRLLHSPLVCHACRHAHFPYGFSSKRETARSLSAINYGVDAQQYRIYLFNRCLN